ncbi:hypothetical protein [Novosphingobium sp. ZW T3_23]|uniref:hypothetical protein n=1 Tax=Novosphingobium sp. ZW T3_23 TaxID=3378084 RepID=UPI003852E776
MVLMVEPIPAPSGAAPCRRAKQIEPRWCRNFLAALAETSNVSAASLAARVPPGTAYRLRRVNPEFAREWHVALLEGYENLEMEVLFRLRFGDPKDGDVKFDNATALRLLGLHRETVARERAARENEDLAAVRASIHAKLAQLRAQVTARRALEAGAESAVEAGHG